MSNDRLQQLLDYLRDDAEDPFLHYAVAMEHVRAGNDAAAEPYFSTLQERFATYLGTYYHYGKLLERTGRKEQAVEVYREGIKVASDARERNALRELKEALALAQGQESDW